MANTPIHDFFKLIWKSACKLKQKKFYGYCCTIGTIPELCFKGKDFTFPIIIVSYVKSKSSKNRCIVSRTAIFFRIVGT